MQRSTTQSPADNIVSCSSRRRRRRCVAELLLFLSFASAVVVLREHRILLQERQLQHQAIDSGGGGRRIPTALLSHQVRQLHARNHLGSLPAGNATVMEQQYEEDVGPFDVSKLIGVKIVKQEYLKVSTPLARKQVQSLLQFGVVGFPKTGTTYLSEWLAAHADLGVLLRSSPEQLALQKKKPANLVRQLHRMIHTENYQKGSSRIGTLAGYKSPQDITTPYALDTLAVYWPQTRLIVGLRHPVLWFQSYYNFRLMEMASDGDNINSTNSTTASMLFPPADSYEFLGSCSKPVRGVCTDISKFHKHLSLLGKTQMNTSRELQLAAPPQRAHQEQRPRRFAAMPNPVFLYEIDQVRDKNKERVAQFANDLGNYLGLPSDGGLSIDLMPDAPDPKNYSVRISNPILRKQLMNICEPRYELLRLELMKNARAASSWIREYFLSSRDVTVSSPEYFRKLLERWMDDPCDHSDKESGGSEAAGHGDDVVGAVARSEKRSPV